MPLPVDIRRAENKHRKAELAQTACELRERGWTTAEIAGAIGTSPPWVALQLPRQLLHLTNAELADRREADERRVPLEAVSSVRIANRQLARELRERAKEREREARSTTRRVESERRRKAKAAEVRARRERRIAARVAKAKAKERARRDRRMMTEQRLAFTQPIRLDKPVDGGDVSIGAFIADPRCVDPFECVAADEMGALLAGLDEERVARMDDATRLHLQEKLRAAGYAPRGVQRAEREAEAEVERASGTRIRHRDWSHHKRMRELGREDLLADLDALPKNGSKAAARARRTLLRKAGINPTRKAA